MRVFRACAKVVLTVFAIAGCGSPAPQSDSSPFQETAPALRFQPVTGVGRAPQPFRMRGNQIVTDTFDVRCDLRDGQLTLALQTDLGDAAHLMVSVSRGFRKRGSQDKYPLNYFSESSTIGDWRKPRTITLDDEAWRNQLERGQRVLAMVGEASTVSRIANDIEIEFMVPVNQEPPFEPLNANLSGKAVTRTENLRIVTKTVAVPHPIDASVGKKVFANPLGLVRGATYWASGEVPLVRGIDPPDPIAEIALMRRLSPKERFTILEARMHRSTWWYRVRTRLGEGWISSKALLGQEIVLVQ